MRKESYANSDGAVKTVNVVVETRKEIVKAHLTSKHGKVLCDCYLVPWGNTMLIEGVKLDEYALNKLCRSSRKILKRGQP